MKKNKRKNKAGDTSSFPEVQSSSMSSSLRTPHFALRTRLAERLRGAAFVLILTCVAGRAFIAEMPFRQSPIQISEVVAYMTRGEESPVGLVSRQELARTGLAAVLLGAGALWLIAGAVEGALRVKRSRLAVLLGAFAAWSFASAWRAADARSAWMAWLEQLSLLSAGFVMIQLCNSRRRFVLTAAVLAAVGLSLAVKGWMQVGWERAESARMFQLYGDQRLADMGMTPDDPKAKAYLQRILSPKPTAYIGLSEVLSSGLALTLFATIGLATAKALYARYRRRRDGAMPAGQIHPAFLAAVLTAATILPVAAILVCTRSRGGIGAAGFTLAAVLVGLRYRAALTRRWKLAVATAGVLLALLLAGTAAYGLARDRLPGGKTMSIRWFYWTGSARIVRENPVWGVGPGNFARAYLRVRRPEAEEAVKTPHNVIAHATAQYGLPGGGLYLVFLGGMLILAWKPMSNETALPGGAPALTGSVTIIQRGGAGAPPRDRGKNSLRSLLWSGGCVVLGVFFCRAFFGDAGEDPMLLVLEGVVPAAIFAIALWLERWFGAAVEDVPAESIRAIRVALAAGCSAFVLHGVVSYSLWTPGTAGLFWTALGAAVAGGESRETTLRRLAIPAALLGVAGVTVAAVVFVVPVAERLGYTQKAVDALLHRRPGLAVVEAERAARADPLDAHAAMNASRFCLVSGADRRRNTADGVPPPMAWAKEAIRRGDDAGAYRLAAQTAQELKLPEADDYWRGAIQRDPADSRLRLDYATWLTERQRTAEAAKQLDKAERIDRELRAFNPESIYLFSENEKHQIAVLRMRIRE